MKRFIATLSLLGLTTAATAADLNNIGGLSQAQFRLLSEDLGASLSYKPVLPTEPLGVTGFDVGVEVVATKLENPSVFNTATSNNGDSTLIIPRLHIHKGLPLGMDIGLVYSSIPDSNISLVGGEFRYALVKGGVATPAIGLRLSRTVLQGVDQLDLETTGYDISISKGFAMLTPYLGAGRVRTVSTPTVGALTEESFSAGKVYGGLNMNFALMNFALEADRTGTATSYSVKFGWRF
jgi:hypothetical protein